MGQFKPMVKMETTEPSVILKLKKGGHVAPLHKDADGHTNMKGDSFKAKYSEDPGSYSASGYACAQIIIEAIKAAIAGGEVTRETVRAAALTAGATYDTVLGPVGFDENGDTTQKIISLYKVENGDWVFDAQIDYAAQ